jgi:glycerol-3-phosphate cytidylyltransferase
MEYGGTIIHNAEAVAEYLIHARSEGQSVVTTNGCFDILHAGHIQYLIDAKKLGDILVVGIICDEIVQKLKGNQRPVQCEEDRVAIVSALRMVDCAFIFREEDPREFINVIKPDVHVKGGDYTEDILEKEVVEANGGKIVIVPFKKGRSTSDIVRKIRSLI